MRKLYVLPRFEDRWEYLYLEHGTLEKDREGLVFIDKQGRSLIPIDQLSLVMLGPGTKVTHAAMKAVSENNCLLCWTGEEGVRLYAHSTGGTHGAHRLLRQAESYCRPDLRMRVVRRLYQKRFVEPIPESTSIEQIRGMEGSRVRSFYHRCAEQHGVKWQGRQYDQDRWDRADPLNRALSCANSCLYGVCHSAILSAGYSPAIGFIHVGKMLSFVYDIADLYKTELTVPLAFQAAAGSTEDLEGRVRRLCRDTFYESKLMARILPDISEVLNAGDLLEERAGELEGRAVSLADRTGGGSVPGEPKRAGSGGAVEDDLGEGERGERDDDLERGLAAGL